MRRISTEIAEQLNNVQWQDDRHAQRPWKTTIHEGSLETPLYGGGVQPGQVDQAQPIRVSGLRGHLRFWWRVACGPFADSTEMFRRESAIWGGIGQQEAKASQVRVRVFGVGAVQTLPAFQYERSRDGNKFATMPKEAEWVNAYAVFPARGKLTGDKRDIDEQPHALVKDRVAFTLRLDLHPDLTEQQCAEVDAALRWWASFGGIGARTRRGLGSILIRGLAPVTAEEVQARGGRLALRPRKADAPLAWKEAVSRLQAYRQKAHVGRNPPSGGGGVPAGRSRWPEPDLIRRVQKTHAPKHPPVHPVQDLTPRAAFGLPIIFQFKDQNKDQNISDPSQQQLRPENGDRMASPLLLRAYWNGQAWHPSALLLPEWERALNTRTTLGQDPTFATWPQSAAERAQSAGLILPMRDRGDDPLSAFLTYFLED